MKILYAVTLLMICAGNVFGQKEGNIWLGGQFAGINFNSGTAIPFLRPDDSTGGLLPTVSIMCDSNGNLLFYSNGFRIFNKNYQIMLNGDSLDIGDYLFWGYNELSTPNAIVIIPVPRSIGKYYLFHTDLNETYDTITNGAFFPEKLQYSIVDMTLDNGLGAVVSGEKNIKILDDTLTDTGIEAVKQGNGRDGWIICHKYNSNRYYRFLVDEKGVHGPYSQDIGYQISEINAVVFSEFRFSQDGSHAMQVDHDSTFLEYYDFDRCTGELSNQRIIHASDTSYNIEGMSFSPSGRYIYLSANHWHYLLQFDLWANNIDSSRVLIGIYDGTLNPNQTDFSEQAIGPDGKIYICNYGENFSLHVINAPDSPGLKCNFVQNGFPLLQWSTWFGGFPNEPNYSLGALSGSNCDSIATYIQPAKLAPSIDVYSNPFTNNFQLSIIGINSKTEVMIYNQMGEVIQQTTWSPVNGFIHGFFNLQNEPAGVYLLEAHTDRGDIAVKILKQ